MFSYGIFISLLLLLFPTKANILIGVDEMKDIIGTEKGVIKLVDSYIESEKARLAKLKQFSSDYKERIQTFSTTGLTNPISAFLTVKQLLKDWTYVEDLARQTSATGFLHNLTKQRSQFRVQFPDTEDVETAAVALLRLQDIYKVDTADMANGQIAGIQQARPLSAHECYEIGLAAFNVGDHYHSVLWMQEALNRTQLEQQNTTANEIDVVEHLAYSLHKKGNLERSLMQYKRLLELVPTHNKAALMVDNYEKQLKVTSTCEIPPLININPLPEKDRYLSLCRLKQQSTVTNVSADNRRKLSCYYKRDKPFLLLAPIHAEVIHLKPKIYIFRDVITPFEAKVLKGLSYPKFENSLVRTKVTGHPMLASSRIAKSAWHGDTVNPVVKRLTKRIELMTNLNLATAEWLQVTNYGLGGYYDPHFDYIGKDEAGQYGSNGNRIATLLLYINQPDIGGATVFPRLNVSIPATVLDAAFWYNVKASGEVDPSTIHAGCPVLVVGTKWIRERGQEFRRPCGLSQDFYE